jgi:AcrR family transcriptional regulator
VLKRSESAAPAITEDLWADVNPEAARRLLVAAVEAFADRGYHATTTRDIAARAAMSPAAVYIHYPTKEDLLYRIAVVGTEHALRVIEHAERGITDPRERAAALVRAFARWVATHHTTARVVIYEMGALTPEHLAEISGLRRQLERITRETVAEGVRGDVFTVPDVQGAARALLSLIIDISRWFGQEHQQTADQVADLYSKLILQMLGCPDRTQLNEDHSVPL